MEAAVGSKFNIEVDSSSLHPKIPLTRNLYSAIDFVYLITKKVILRSNLAPL